jgi:hypothetical protein
MTRILIPMIPPSPNELRRKYRNPFAYKRLREAWEQSLAYGVESAEVHQALVQRAKNRRVRVAIAIYHRRAYDQDNLYGCLKPVLDAMRNVGYIRNDDRSWLKLNVKQYPDIGKFGNCTIIEIDG